MPVAPSKKPLAQCIRAARINPLLASGLVSCAGPPPADGAYLPTEDPFTGATWAQIARGTADDANAAVEAADRAFHGPWSRLSATERGHLLWRLGDLVQANAAQLAETERRDNGKLA